MQAIRSSQTKVETHRERIKGPQCGWARKRKTHSLLSRLGFHFYSHTGQTQILSPRKTLSRTSVNMSGKIPYSSVILILQITISLRFYFLSVYLNLFTPSCSNSPGPENYRPQNFCPALCTLIKYSDKHTRESRQSHTTLTGATRQPRSLPSLIWKKKQEQQQVPVKSTVLHKSTAAHLQLIKNQPAESVPVTLPCRHFYSQPHLVFHKLIKQMLISFERRMTLRPLMSSENISIEVIKNMFRQNSSAKHVDNVHCCLDL